MEEKINDFLKELGEEPVKNNLTFKMFKRMLDNNIKPQVALGTNDELIIMDLITETYIRSGIVSSEKVWEEIAKCL